MEPKRRGFRNLAAKLSRLVDKSSSKHSSIVGEGAVALTPADEGAALVEDTDIPTATDCDRFDELELGVIAKLYAELLSRSKQPPSQTPPSEAGTSGPASEPAVPAEAVINGIDKATFTEYFQLPGLWADGLFKIFTDGQVVTFADFVHGLSMCCRGTKTERVGILFKLFDLNDDGVVGKDELTAMLSNMPQLNSYLQSSNTPGVVHSCVIDKPCSVECRSHPKPTAILSEVRKADESESSCRETSSMDWSIDDRSSSSASIRGFAVPRDDDYDINESKDGSIEEEEEEEEEEDEDENSLQNEAPTSLLGPSPMVTEMLARVKRDAAVETESNDLEALVSSILDQYDACGSDQLDLDSFRLFVDHHPAILRLFSDCLREDVWSMKGHALGRLANKQMHEHHADNTLEQWISVRKQFMRIVPRQFQNGKEERAGLSGGSSEERPTPLSAGQSAATFVVQGTNETDTDVTRFLGLSGPANPPFTGSGCGGQGSLTGHTVRGRRQMELNCPGCLAPLVVCPQCDGRYPDLRIHKDAVYVLCRSCGRKSTECWICGFNFSSTFAAGASEFQMQGDLYSSDGRKHHFLLVDKLLYYFDRDGDKVPSGFIFLEGCYVEPLEEGPPFGFSIILRKVSDKKKTFYAPDAESYARWLEALKSELSQRPIQELYEMHETIGQGKFSVVYRATEIETGECVAIKVVHKSKMNASEMELLRSEMCILRMLRHPHVICLKQVVSSRDSLYIVMEYVPGGELFKVISRQQGQRSKNASAAAGEAASAPQTPPSNKPLLEETAVHRLTAQLLKTLAYLHKSGIVHRDLKPENILLTNSQDIGQADVKIADFGLSCLCGPNELLTQPCGTLVYAAPEVLTLKGYNHKVDVWSVGVVVYLLLCGKLPFPALRNVKSLDDLDSFFKVKFDAASWTNVSPTCKDFISKLLVVDPQQRFTSQQALSHIWIKNPEAVIGE